MHYTEMEVTTNRSVSCTGTSDEEGGIGIFGFGYILNRLFGFCAKKLRFFGFGVRCGLRIFRILAFGFRFPRKLLTGFRI